MIHDARGFWLADAGPVEPAPPLEGEAHADVVIVGGGYTGMWTAWHLLEAAPDARIVLVEAGLCGHGPSGRNGGFLEAQWLQAPELRRRHGDGPARAQLEASIASLEAIARWCEEEGVDAGLRRGGYLRVSASPAQDGAWAEAVAACAALGLGDELRPLSAEEVRARCDSPAFRGGVLAPRGATVHPARLALGLRRRLLERGVAIRERSPVVALREEAGQVTAETAGGRVRAGAGVLAAGARIMGVRSLRRRLTVASSHACATEPVPDVLDRLGWRGGECIADYRTFLHYFRVTPDDRVVFGWAGGRIGCGRRVGGLLEVDPDPIAEARRALARLLPPLADRAITHAWGGPIDVSPTHLPFAGTLPGGRVHYAAGYTGNGVGPTHLAGRALVALALDRRDAVTRLPFVEPEPVRVPPEPLRWLGGSLVRRAVLRAERLEDEGRRPDPLSAFVRALPGRLGIHLGR